MKRLHAAILASGISLAFCATCCARQDAHSTHLDALIDALCEVDHPTIALHPTAYADGFLAEGSVATFRGGVFGSVAPTNCMAMREIVGIGADAVPSLLHHLTDDRPTRLQIGGDRFLISAWFSDEYDPRDQEARKRQWEMTYGGSVQALEAMMDKITRESLERAVKLPYTVKVGDVCYALLGQIVNRSLLPIRYQPSQGAVINSPVHTPEITRAAKRDWSGLTEEELKRSLIKDAVAAEKLEDSGYGAALRRLRFYFPAAYERERSGTLAEKIRKHEASNSHQGEPQRPAEPSSAGAPEGR